MTEATSEPGNGASRWALYPMILAAVFVMETAASNGVEPPGWIRPLLVAVVLAAAMTAIAWVATRHRSAAGLLATIALLAVASRDVLASLATALRDTFGPSGAVVASAGLVFLMAAIAVAAVPALWRGRHRWLEPTTRFLNIASVVLLLLVAWPALVAAPAWFTRPQPTAAEPERELPDIYVFVLDGYARSDELQRQFGIDNASFLTGLAARGFDVADDNHSNYTYTVLTFASLFGLQYLTADRDAVFTDDQLRAGLRDALHDGAGITALRAAGYTIVASAAGWEHVALRDGADRYLDRPELTDLERTLLQKTWVPDLSPVVPGDLFFADLHRRVTGVLGDASDLAAARRDRPMFAFIHVPAPHLPMAFGPVGGPAPFTSRQYGAGRPSEFGLTDDAYASAYAASVEGLNEAILESIDRIIANSARPPVVVLMSDHGYNGDSPTHGESMLRSLFAASTPGAPGLLDPAPTPVNMLGILLEHYAGANLGPLLPDRFFLTQLDGSQVTITETEVTD